MMDVVVSGLVWLPKSDLSGLNIRNIKDKLVVYPKKTTDIASKPHPRPIYLYSETEKYLGVPRYWYLKNVTKEHNEELRISYGHDISGLRTNYSAEGKFVEQLDALRVMENCLDGREWGGVLLKAGCGFGKSNSVIELARRLGRSTIVLVHKEFFLEQWSERIKSLLPDAKVGIIRQDICDYKGKDFVIGMIQSLEKRGKYSKELFSSFGTMIVDEIHRMGSASWGKVAPWFNSAWRIGITATPYRKDNAQAVFIEHISDISYSAETEAMVPDVEILKTDSVLRNINSGDYYCPASKLNSAQVINQLADDEIRNRDIVDRLVWLISDGRKVMVISDRLAHLKDIGDAVDKAMDGIDLPYDVKIDYLVGDWFTGDVWERDTKTHKAGDPKLKKRTREEFKAAERANLILCTRQIISEGIDIQSLDVIVLAMPYSDPEQAIGRVRRWCTPDKSKCDRLCSWRSGLCEGKPTPLIVDVVDKNVPRLLSKFERRKEFYNRIGVKNPEV